MSERVPNGNSSMQIITCLSRLQIHASCKQAERQTERERENKMAKVSINFDSRKYLLPMTESIDKATAHETCPK